ncbi:uncharacterized protein Z520_07290 [Fonsecaea multimorphosa CBS 102226]|uniref:Uncharacterized protein n=1 Tax=Fonsecaea multimorphosa CBS 102226 TaxID=1442371 RepID=A0A0D2IJD8_9EURO|nr:uncharacterized protein Z520_07290 [Fonsecaea multimorphosa CBS 102226]KIX97176.1 hypothetical protein Z520_07290 [Fonsecaea multimorphosa CBS 102226]OAL22952.1 hypothetical protein AYO22_06860 [Fonsecaea multimorphosa]
MADREPSPTLLSSSAQRRPHMSITLPRNFAPLGLDGGDDPKTPDQTFAELKLPPPPHHSTCRLRRSRIRMDNFQARNNALPATLFASDIPIPSSAHSVQKEPEFADVDFALPSIEMHSHSGRPIYNHSVTDPSPSERLKLSAFRDSHLPRTPVAQTKIVLPDYKNGAWDMHRSASECSLRSDSSFTSSEDTFTTRPTSFDGSATSPENESQDPFSPTKVNIIPDTPSRKNKKLKVNTMLSKANVQWSIEMDNHLFNVYQMYLADPTVTPFKTVPGSIPPTGVCHRVARRAKETWPRASRVNKPLIRRYKMRNVIETRITARDKTPEPNDFLRTDHNDARGAWPSESATRRRLKQLCKEKFTITAHYQRLRESRSPSPFHEQFLRRPSSRLSRSVSNQDPQASTTYATRELGISLVASGATAPLAQLVTGESPPSQQMSDDWFNTPVNHSSDTMSLSTPAGLGIQSEPDKLQVATNIPRLASPFNYSTWNGSGNSNTQHRRHISHHHFDTVHATGTRLLSPFKLEPESSLNVNKRRAQHNLEDELSPSGSNIEKLNVNLNRLPAPTAFEPEPQVRPELIFTGAGDLNQRRIRVRNRGATLGAVNNREHVERIFTPPTTQIPGADGIPPVPPLPASLIALANPNARLGSGGLAPPEPDSAQKRLGSPFELDPNKRSYRSKNPRHVPSLSDPFISTSAFATTPNHGHNGMSIGERLAMFNTFHPPPFPRQMANPQPRDDPFA